LSGFLILSYNNFKVYAETNGKSLEFNKKRTKVHSRYKRFWSSQQEEFIFTLIGYLDVDFVADIGDRT
jgi:hypothetical protein